MALGGDLALIYIKEDDITNIALAVIQTILKIRHWDLRHKQQSTIIIKKRKNYVRRETTEAPFFRR